MPPPCPDAPHPRLPVTGVILGAGLVAAVGTAVISAVAVTRWCNPPRSWDAAVSAFVRADPWLIPCFDWIDRFVSRGIIGITRLPVPVTGLTVVPPSVPVGPAVDEARPQLFVTADLQPADSAPADSSPVPPAGAAPAGEGTEPTLPAYGSDVPDYDQPALFDPLTPRSWVRYAPRPLNPAVPEPEAAIPSPQPTPTPADPAPEPTRAEQLLTYGNAQNPDDLGRTLDPNARFYEAAVPPEIPDGSPPFSGNEEFAIQSGRGWLPKGRLLLRLSAGGIFDDNVALRERGRKSDFIFTLSPSVTYAIGSAEGRFSLLANYTPTVLLYARGTADDSVDHAGVIALRYRFSKLTLGGTFVARSMTGSSRDVGDRVSRILYYLGGSANYLYSEKLSFDLNGDLAYSDFKGLLGSDEARLQAFVNFAVRPKLQLGAGFLFGVLSVDHGPTQTYEQFLARALYVPTAKLGFNASVGLEVRQLGSGVSGQLSPVLSLGVAYEPWVNTSFTLDARHRTYPSAALTGQDYQATGLTLGVRRSNLADRFSASFVFGYEHTGYEETTRGVSATRQDDFFYTQVGLGMSIRRFLYLSAFYEFSFNDSRGGGSREFHRNRIGLLTTFTF